MTVQVSAVLCSTVLDSDWHFENYEEVIIKVKASCVLPVDCTKLTGQLRCDGITTLLSCDLRHDSSVQTIKQKCYW